jgi:eukaryotic-like serine/threonine-protein kinase
MNVMKPATLSPETGRQPDAGKYTYASGSRPLDGYTIKRGVGSGGFGEVYFATSDAGKEVALKLIRRNLDIELRGVQQCLNLKHPNLLTLYDVRQDGRGDSWVVMEYVGGECLEDVLARHPDGLPPADALRWFHGLADAVGYLHDHGIVHRDLKPGNIFDDEGVIKLGDYGLSKFISVSRRSGQTESVGTVHYMAPEIANGCYGKEIDIYALGILLYELLTGHLPFEGESIGEVLMKHLTAQPDLSRLAEPYRGAVQACLAKDPILRPPSVAQLCAMLTPGGASAAPSAKAAIPTMTPKPAPVAGQSVPRGWAGLNTPTKTAVIFLVIYCLLRVTPNLWQTMLIALLAAGGYWLVRSRTGPSISESTRTSEIDRRPPPTPPPAPVSRAIEVVAPGPARSTRGRPVEVLPLKSQRERIADLLGSLLVSTGVVAALSLTAVIVRGTMPQPEQFAWQSIVSVLGAWLVLIPAKLWEGTAGDVALRRFTCLLLGLLLGLFAWGLDQALLVDLGYEMHVPPHALQWQLGAYGPDGQPQLLAYLAYFGFLFLVPRWWRQADPLRTKRVSLGSTATCVATAWALNWMWSFPQPWGMISAGTISLAVQLASPWIDRSGNRAQRARPSTTEG